MSYKEFIRYIKENVGIILGEQVTVSAQSVRKNNSLILEGICIQEENKKMAPTIYLEFYYEAYLKGKPLGEIILEVLSVYQKFKVEDMFEMDFFMNYERTKGRILYKLINYQKNKELLEDVPYVAFLDLAIVFYCMVMNDQNGSATILIHYSHLEMWGITVKELYKNAKENTRKLLCSEIKEMNQVIEELFGEKSPGNNEEKGECGRMYILSNTAKLNGAVCILYQNLLSSFAESIGSDLFILPSSIHEVILIPADGKILQTELEEMVMEVNQTQVETEDILSDHVYYFSRKEKKILL